MNAHSGAVHRVAVDLRGVEQGLGGDTAPVQAGTAHLPALHHGGMQSQRGGAERRRVAPGTGADNKQLIVHTHSSGRQRSTG